MLRLAGFEAVTGCDQLWLEPEFLSSQEADQILLGLLTQTQWPDSDYEVFGRRFKLPRLQSWHADPGIVYSYSDNLLETRAWTPLLNQLRQRVQERLNAPFNAVLVNWYRDGNDHVGWHSDDERELGAAPVIASLSLGVTRPFAFRRRSEFIRTEVTRDANVTSQCPGELALTHGSLLVMQPSFQHQWEHQVPVAHGGDIRQDTRTGRLNLTFRQVLAPTESTTA